MLGLQVDSFCGSESLFIYLFIFTSIFMTMLSLHLTTAVEQDFCQEKTYMDKGQKHLNCHVCVLVKVKLL